MAGVTTVCTGWHPAAWGEYARRFSETFNLHWSAEVHFVSFISPDIINPVFIIQIPIHGFFKPFFKLIFGKNRFPA